MRDEIRITPGAIRVTQVSQQPLDQAIEVSAYVELELLLSALVLEGGGSATIKVTTGMQKDSAAGWVPVITFTAVTGNTIFEKMTATGLLRYVRWEVTALTGTAITFGISGMARRCMA